MYTIKNYVRADSLEQAYELLKKGRNNIIIGGNLWLKMGKRNILNAIDLSGLSLDKIEEEEEGYRIGCMVSLRDLEVHQGLNDRFGHIFYEALHHIVGVQFRNMATVGGSVFPRFGFSDVLSVFLACDAYVDLYQRGTVSLKEFVSMPMEKDILTHIYIKKDNREVRYQSFRMTETDFPSLTCAVAKVGEEWETVLGARPLPAVKIHKISLKDPKDEEQRRNYIEEVVKQVSFGTNMRGSADYRKELARVLIGRCIKEIAEDKVC